MTLNLDANRGQFISKFKSHQFINRLTITDRSSSTNFLVDTGADISAIPYNSNDKSIIPCKSFPLFAANNSVIKVYGSKRLELNLGLRRAFTWDFIVADIQTPIMSSDFLSHFNLLVDVKNNQLIDQTTNMRTGNLSKIRANVPSIKLIKTNQCFADILKTFPEITQQKKLGTAIKTDTTHHIITNGRPVFCRPRKLNPAKLEAAKKEIPELLDGGIIRP